MKKRGRDWPILKESRETTFLPLWGWAAFVLEYFTSILPLFYLFLPLFYLYFTSFYLYLTLFYLYEGEQCLS